MVAKAARSDADLVFLDLEDSVAPARKAAARETVVEGLNELDWGSKTRAVRINHAGSEWAYDDLVEVVRRAGSRLDIVIVPKVRGVPDVWWVDSILTELEPKLGRPQPIGLEVLIEEVEALTCVDEIANASKRLEALIFGSGDFAASQGVRTRRLSEFEGDIWAYPRSRIVVAARAAGIEAVDGPYWGAIQDHEGYRTECVQASILGFSGKWAIHPDQIPVANEAFSPTTDEIEHARRVSRAYDEALENGQGAIVLDGLMVDMVDVRLAQALLERAEIIRRAAEETPS
jgi:citrate lyase subunit beta / citryl-CoA lyase